MGSKPAPDLEPQNIEVKARKARKIANPLQAGISEFLFTEYQRNILELKDIPKRYTRYGSLLLLNPTFFTHSQAWSGVFGSLTVQKRIELFHSVTEAFRDTTLTHVAINAPIVANRTGDEGEELNETRSPVNLLPVYGDFGPGVDVCDDRHPTQSDLSTAYWTQTVQLNDIVQVWAPRWTMFSRGNIAEKSRILQAGLTKSPFPGLTDAELGQSIHQVDVVDFYVGIGYFAFCYLAKGVARVWGWEINGWSVEGLRRGCVKNGWPVRVVKLDDNGVVTHGPNIRELVKEILELQRTPYAIKCVVFWGDNRWSSKVLKEVGSCMSIDGRGNAVNIRHCNLGLLPTSEGSWRCALEVLNASTGGWLHIHENVDAPAMFEKQRKIETQLKQMATEYYQKPWLATCCHVEQVKTYAPGVIHCVYDISLYPAR